MAIAFSFLISRVLCLAGRAAVRTIKVKGISLRRTVRLPRQPGCLFHLQPTGAVRHGLVSMASRIRS